MKHPVRALAALLLMMPFMTVATAWAVVTLWSWFVVPTFGAPTLHLAVAIGLMALLAVVRPHKADENDDTKETLSVVAEAIGAFITRVGLGLAVGWVALQFTPYA